MPLISNVGKKTAMVRLLVAVLYAIIIAGAITMVYPFLIMVSGSFKTEVDKNDFDAFPAFFTNDVVLYRKHIEGKYNRIVDYNPCNRERVYGFRFIDPPVPIHRQRVIDWKEFEKRCDPPPSTYHLGYTAGRGTLRAWKNREFRHHLMDICNGDIRIYNSKFGAQEENWLGVVCPLERIVERRYRLLDDPITKELYDFKAAQPTWFRVYVSIDGVFAQDVLSAIYGTDIHKYNEKMGTGWESFPEMTIPRTAPANKGEREDWGRYVREDLNLQFIRVKEEARPLFAKHLSDRYAGDMKMLNERYGTNYGSFEEVTYPGNYITASHRLVDWAEFVKAVPIEHLYLKTPEFDFRDFLKEKYKGDLEALNRAHEARYSSFEVISMPTREVDYVDFLENRKAIRHEFITVNYKQVFDFIFLHGRSLVNTVIYCALAIITALVVNPMAAYALSRYKPPSTYKLLLFCMATMAFPQAVTMIPSFLLLKELKLLNSFAALILPGMTNGFMIFLLKGFFDSLPRELYEQGQIDGASEWVMFWNLTMSLSKPILAVVALGAFTGAYGNFMFAFILCPKEEMWTLMVFLYQFQQRGSQGLTFAALLVACIPTFIVFVFCQNIIIRGIVVPVEK